MMRRPTTTDGVLVPQLFGGGVAVGLLGGLVRQFGTTPLAGRVGGWLIAAGAMVLVTALLVAWRVLHGALVAAGLWLVFAAALLALAVPARYEAHALAAEVAATGAWLLASMALVRGLGAVGAGISAGLGCLLNAAVWRALPAVVGVHAWWPASAAGGLLVLIGTAFLVQRGRSGSQGTVKRWGARVRRNDGVASRWQLLKVASRFAVRRKMTVLSPSTQVLSRWRRLRVPTTRVATRVARVGLLPVWVTVENVTLRFGGPRKGKSAELAGRIVDAPGAVIATSTRTDLIDLTRPVRDKLGPIYVFNPSGMGGLASTITFDPIVGCRDPKTATDRAADLVAAVSSPGRDDGNREFWSNQARRVLAALMHAAALGDLGMADVLEWVAKSDETETLEDVQRFLRRSPVGNFESDALQFLTTNPNTRTSITSTIMPALGWLTDPIAAKAATGGGFDVERLLTDRGTVYMLGAEDAQTAPLVTALTGHIAREARRVAAAQPGGRLDPSLTLALDEAAIICPVPLDKWTADMGGRNITIHAAVQSRAQLRQRYGDAGAATIINNTSTLLVFGGTRDPEDLAAYVTLAGEREEEVRTYDHVQRKHSTTTRKVPVLTAAQIAQLPPMHVMIVHSGMPVAVGKVQPAWGRRDVRRAKAELAGIVALQVRVARWAAWPVATVRWVLSRRRLDRELTAVLELPAAGGVQDTVPAKPAGSSADTSEGGRS